MFIIVHKDLKYILAKSYNSCLILVIIENIIIHFKNVCSMSYTKPVCVCVETCTQLHITLSILEVRSKSIY